MPLYDALYWCDFADAIRGLRLDRHGDRGLFAPEEDCAAFAVRAIDNADREILVAAYRLTVGSGIVGALIRANERGVDVRVIAARRRRADAQVASIRWQPLAYRSGSTIERVSRMPRRWS